MGAYTQIFVGALQSELWIEARCLESLRIKLNGLIKEVVFVGGGSP